MIPPARADGRIRDEARMGDGNGMDADDHGCTARPFPEYEDSELFDVVWWGPGSRELARYNLWDVLKEWVRDHHFTLEGHAVTVELAGKPDAAAPAGDGSGQAQVMDTEFEASVLLHQAKIARRDHTPVMLTLDQGEAIVAQLRRWKDGVEPGRLVVEWRDVDGNTIDAHPLHEVLLPYALSVWGKSGRTSAVIRMVPNKVDTMGAQRTHQDAPGTP